MAVLRGLRRRPVLAAALIYLALAMLMVGPALLPGKTLSNSDTNWFQPPWRGVKPPQPVLPTNSELGDAPVQLQPFARYGTGRMPDIPLWNPYIVGGRPFLANAQSALFSPYTLPAYVLPFWAALPWIGVLKLWVAAFGMFLLGRALGMRFGGALLAGIVFAFSLWMVTWLSYPHMSVWTWIPWLLLLTDRLVRKPDLLTGSGLAAVVGLQLLGGHPESSFHAMVVTVCFLALRLVQARRTEGFEHGPPVRVGLAFVAASLGGLALSALVMVPFGELLLGSADLLDRRGDSIDLQPISRDFTLGIFLPDYWGRATQTPLKIFVLDRALYVGALPLMLAGAAVVIRPTLERVAVAVWGAVWLAVLFGIPPFLQIVTRLPVFSSGHNSRLSIFFVLSVALLAGWGLDELTAGAWQRSRRRLTLALAAALAAAPVVFVILARRTTVHVFGQALDVAWGFATAPGGYVNYTGGRGCIPPCVHSGDVIRLASVIGWATLAGAALLLIALRFRGRLSTTPFVVCAVALVCVDLFHAGMGYNPAIDRKYASQPATAAIRLLERQGLARYVSIEGVPQDLVPMRFGLYESRGYDLPIMHRFDRIWRREVSPESSSVAKGLSNVPLTLRNVTPRALRVQRLLGVTHLLQPPTAPVLHVAGMQLVYDGRDARVYRVEGALPRAFVVGGQRVVGGGERALDVVTSAGFDGRRVAVTEGRVAGLPVGEGLSGGRARIVSYAPERVVVRARSGGPGLLVLGDNYYPGWKAYVNGRSVPIERVDYLFRGVRVGAGVSTVEFRYEPLSWRIGWIVSLTALIGLVALIAVATLRAARTGSRSRRRAAAGSSTRA